MTNKDPTLTNGSSDSYSLQISTNSSLSCESDISSFSFDKEVESYTNRIDEDELPAFEIRLLSPLGRTPSPIDSDLEFLSSPTKSCITPTRKSTSSSNRKLSSHGGNSQKDSEDFVTLHDINAQISPPSDSSDNSSSSSNNQTSCDSPQGNLETIFEGVFLNTPPKQQRFQRNGNDIRKQRSNLLEKIAINRLNFVHASSNKENVRTIDSGRDHIATTEDG